MSSTSITKEGLEELRAEVKEFKEARIFITVGTEEKNIEGRVVKVREGTFDIEDTEVEDPNNPELPDTFTIPFSKVKFLLNGLVPDTP